MTAIARSAPQPTVRKQIVRQQREKAPFSLRCGALLIDYIVLTSIIVFATLIARMLGGGARAAGNSAEAIGVAVAAITAVLNLGLLAGLTGATVGKWAAGLRIERNGGGDVGVPRALIRHFVGYPISLLFLGLGFLITIFTERGRGLHDLIAGTIVVRESST